MARETLLTERREPLDLRPWLVVGVGLGTIGLVGAVLCAVWLFEWATGVRSPTVPPPAAFAPPQLQSDPAVELREYQAAQHARLSGYGWADREKAIVRIPIERAMGMIAARGREAYEPLDPPRIPDPRR
jgi:hypothetical protein